MTRITKVVSTSSFNLTQVADNASLSSCPVGVVPVTNGAIRYAGACIPYNSTDLFQVECTNIDRKDIPTTANCDYVFKNIVSKDSTYYCSISCEQSTPGIVPRSLPDYYVSHNSVAMTGGASTIQSSLLLLLSALFITVVMSIKRNH
ncbi:hypothetical protein EDC94DRAFT_699488 [Helicostylum pulchrum]|nr:hypothetical protein EDC94DRAFT_699488 [Helicostylum pulchrum]